MKLYGTKPVIERLKSNPKSIQRIFIQDHYNDAGYVHKKAKKWGIPVITVPKSKIQKMARSVNTQGIIASIEAFPYVSYDEMLDEALKKRSPLLFLDGLTDPQNLGAIIRAVACLGVFSIVLPTHHSVEITEAVLRVACGGDNFIQAAKVANLSQAIKLAKEAGFWITGAVVKGGQSIMEVELPFPLALVIGSEQKGIRPVIDYKSWQRLS